MARLEFTAQQAMAAHHGFLAYLAHESIGGSSRRQAVGALCPKHSGQQEKSHRQPFPSTGQIVAYFSMGHIYSFLGESPKSIGLPNYNISAFFRNHYFWVYRRRDPSLSSVDNTTACHFVFYSLRFRNMRLHLPPFVAPTLAQELAPSVALRFVGSS